MRISLPWLLLLLALAGCPVAHHGPGPALPPDAGELQVDAGTDATVRPLDATLSLDAQPTVDAQTDAGCRGPTFGNCAQRDDASVTCGVGLRCGGSTPICCRHTTVAPSCLAVGVVCGGSSGLTDSWTDACDDGSDCPVGFVCIDSYNKGLNRNDGARCLQSSEAYCGPVPIGTGPLTRYQRCSADCECPLGESCTNAVCKR